MVLFRMAQFRSGDDHEIRAEAAELIHELDAVAKVAGRAIESMDEDSIRSELPNDGKQFLQPGAIQRRSGKTEILEVLFDDPTLRRRIDSARLTHG